MATSLPTGFGYPQAMPIAPPLDADVDMRQAPLVRHQEGEGDATAYILAGGIAATLGLLALVAAKNESDHQGMRKSVDGVNGRLNDYTIRHAQDHEIIARQQAEVDAGLQEQVDLLRFSQQAAAVPSARMVTTYGEPLGYVPSAPAYASIAPVPSVAPMASMMPVASMAPVTQVLGSRLSRSRAPTMPFVPVASMALVPSARPVTVLRSDLEDAVAQVLAAPASVAPVAQEVPVASLGYPSVTAPSRAVTLVEDAPVSYAAPASFAPASYARPSRGAVTLVEDMPAMSMRPATTLPYATSSAYTTRASRYASQGV